MTPARRRAVALLLALAAPSAAAYAGECGRAGVRVDGADAAALALACGAVEAVVGYFAALGLAVDPDVRIVFQPRVSIEGAGPGARPLAVSGCYDRRTETIRVVDWRSSGIERRPWGLPFDAAMARSVLEHELAHMVVARRLGGGAARLGGAWHELVAYAAQLALAPPARRALVLARYPDAGPFASPWEINQATYAADPDRFAVRAYRHVEANGGAAFLRAILAGETLAGMGETSHICR